MFLNKVVKINRIGFADGRFEKLANGSLLAAYLLLGVGIITDTLAHWTYTPEEFDNLIFKVEKAKEESESFEQA